MWDCHRQLSHWIKTQVSRTLVLLIEEHSVPPPSVLHACFQKHFRKQSQTLPSFLLQTTDQNPDRIHAVCVCDSADLFYQHIESQLEAFGLTKDTQGRPIKARDLVDIVDGYKGLGYGKSTEEELGEKVECH